MIDGNKKNHKTAHRNAKSKADINDQMQADKHFAAASHFHYLMHLIPKTTLMFIKLLKLLNDKNIMVMFESSAQATWSRILRSIRGGFIQIPEEIMTNPEFKNFRKDFGLDDPNLSNNPTIMEILGDHKLFMSTYRYTPGKDGTILMKKQHRPMGMNYTEQHFYEMFYEHLDYAVDAIDLIVLQNDHREPIVEVLVQLEGNTIQAEIQNAIAHYVPNWDTTRTRYTVDGHLYYYKDQNGEYDRSTRIKCKSGLPKVQLPLYGHTDRIHMINVAAQLESTQDNQTEAHLRLLDSDRRQKSQRNRLWRERAEQIKRHVDEDQDVEQQLECEMNTFMDPLQTYVGGRYQGPRYQTIMAPEYKAAMAAEKSSPDIRVKERALNFEQNVRNTFSNLERTMVHVRLPTTPGTRYHSGLSPDVLEQTEKPGLAKMHAVNHERLMKVLTQERFFRTHVIKNNKI